MNSALKELERNCAPIEFIDPLARLVLDDLAIWANDNIYSSHSGCLTYELPLDESINAACTSYHDSRYRAHIKINLGMVQEIYIQSFTYPGYIKNLESSNWHFNALDEPFRDAEFLFEGGIPPRVRASETVAHMVELYKNIPNNRNAMWTDEELICRFTMFELMIAWIFFHELAHHVQGHYKIKNEIKESVTYHELDYSSNINNSNSEVTPSVIKKNIDQHAREILADLEGMYLTMRMMVRNDTLTPPNTFLLLYVQTSMFNVFYKLSEGEYTDLDSVKVTHPHPVIRNKFVHALYFSVMSWELDNDIYQDYRQSVSRGLEYYTVKSSLLAGMIWAMRQPDYSPDAMPQFLKFSDESEYSTDYNYLSELTLSAERQSSIISLLHIIDDDLDNVFKLTKLDKLFSHFLNIKGE
ncbi:hypothetical protein N8V20_21670 [Enterobacter hormaechei subsp. steigerwaltii]|nr:hypothetical protein [Enterobacter hormaechei]MCU2904433.1 hypothetical protein [Enterobacter hormaechei subsp. steigerwaltii]EKY3928918.1 hypothetical protein [Enterobacter hormaechei]MCU3214876.1 hypothetical protein [Enterobacter hormaechei subsp. steigerwaltii]MCU3370749.1 hypothetical protein [Enterobacter hormaechei subsp. steigerwaltii]MCU3437921.1 hypothetical protein [Enterobacter hormaechei subsp. steigerwaltii]